MWKSALVSFVLFFAHLNLSIGQQLEYLNKYFFRVNDTIAYRYEYFKITKESPSTKVMITYARDSSKISQKTILKNELGSDTNELTLHFSKNGKLIYNEKKNLLSDVAQVKEFYENGQLRLEKEVIGDSLINEIYFSEVGDLINKPIIVSATPKDGMPGWNKYLSLTLRYPIRSRQNNSEGVAYVAFEVDESGKIQNVEVANPEEIDPLLAQEALRAIEKYPYLWTPMLVDGKPQYCKTKLPVNFRLTD